MSNYLYLTGANRTSWGGEWARGRSGKGAKKPATSFFDVACWTP